jgi:hypothetical protein
VKSVSRLVSIGAARLAKASSEGWRLRLRPNNAMQCLIKADLQGIVHTMNLAMASPNRGGDWSMAEFIVDEVLLRSPSQSSIPRTASIAGIASTRHRRPTQSTERAVIGES